MRRGLLVLALALATLALPAPAMAAAEFGDECLADTAKPGLTLTQLQRASGSGLPLTAPSDGIVTSWNVRVAPGFPVQQAPVRLKLLRPTAAPNTFKVVGESADALAAIPAFAQDTRIAVQAGDRLGLYTEGGDGTLTCGSDDEGDVLGTYKGDALRGLEYAFAQAAKFRLPVTAKIEPDADGDGYGDESQDKCPRSPDHHDGCPVIRLEIAEFWAKRHTILLRITTSARTEVRVTGQVGWGFKPSPKLKTAGDKPTRLIVGLRGGRKTVAPGQARVFRVQLPKAVLRRLSRIGSRQSLKAKLVASTEDLAGRIDVERVTVRLKGRDSG
jgi:hypothetical protein